MVSLNDRAGARGQWPPRPVFVCLLAFVSSLGFALAPAALAATMGPQPASYAPGFTSHVPIVLDLGSAQADRMGFSLQVIPSAGAPALTQNLGFEAVDVPVPSMVNPTTTNISVSWFTPMSPPRTGRVTLGNVLVPIPGNASMSDTYTVQMLNAGASLGPDEIPVALGPDVVLGAPPGPPVITITITLQQLGVDVTPTIWSLGIVGFGGTKHTWVSGTPGLFTATNSGNVEEDFSISATSTSPTGWDPGPSPDVDTFVICFGIGESPYASPPAWTCFEEAPVTMGPPLPVSESLPFDLKFTAPTAGTSGGESESFVVSMAAAAH